MKDLVKKKKEITTWNKINTAYKINHYFSITKIIKQQKLFLQRKKKVHILMTIDMEIFKRI